MLWGGMRLAEGRQVNALPRVSSGPSSSGSTLLNFFELGVGGDRFRFGTPWYSSHKPLVLFARIWVWCAVLTAVTMPPVVQRQSS